MLEAKRSVGRAIVTIVAMAFAATACSSDSDDGGVATGSGAAGGSGGSSGGSGGSSGGSGGSTGGNGGSAGGGAAAGSDAGADANTDGDAPGPTSTFQYVVKQITLPLSVSEFAIDLNGDAKADNRFAAIVGALSAQGLALQVEQTAIVDGGEALELLALRTHDASLSTDANAALDVYRAQATAAPDFTGSGSFGVDASVPSLTLSGDLANAIFQSNAPPSGVAPTNLRIRLAVLGEVPLLAAQVRFTAAEGALTQGQINGAIKKADLDAVAIPAFAERIDAIAQESPCSSTCAQVLQIFDTDMDGSITTTEVATNTIFSNVLAPDVDLLDASGNYAPSAANTDKDCLSVGIGFAAVKASFTP